MQKYTVEDTNNDALIAKISAISKGYYEDKYAYSFIQSKNVIKKDLIINRGYWLIYKN